MTETNPFELDRVSIRLVRDPGGPLISDQPLNSPNAVARFLQEEIFGDLDREVFAVVNLKANHSFSGMKVISFEPDKEFQGMQPSSINICSMGTLSESPVHPREVLKSSILSNASAVLLVHNHPSGQLTPSKEDVEVTDRLMQAYNLMGIRVLDHIILGPQEQYYSFAVDEILPFPENEYISERGELSFTGQSVEVPGFNLKKEEKDPFSRVSAINRLEDAKEKTGQKRGASVRKSAPLSERGGER